MSVPRSSPISEIAKKRIDEINAKIDDIAASVRDIVDATARQKLETKLMVVVTKKARIRTMSSIAELKKMQAELDIIIVSAEMGLELADLGVKRRSEEDPRDGKRLKGDENADAKPSSKPTCGSSKSSSTKKSPKEASKPQKVPEKSSKPVDENVNPRHTSTPRKKQDKQSRHMPETGQDEKTTGNPGRKNSGSAVNPSQLAGARESENIHEHTTNKLFKEIMENKVANIKTEEESISSIKTLIIDTGLLL